MKVEYITHTGSDDLVVDAARVSFDKRSENYTPESNAKLITYLARHGHWTPFAHPQITLCCTVPIFVARQDFKHQVGFVRNEVSRRYVDDTPEFFYPQWRNRPEASIKQGSGDKHSHDAEWHARYHAHCEAVLGLYDAMIKDGVAPEQARMVLPQSMFTSYYTTGSLAAWARAYKQRVDPHAQVEIQQLAKLWGDVIEPLFPISWVALTQ